MEKLNFVKNGVLRLPPGFRFHPTDEELVVQYLKRKVHSWPLPASIIPEVDVCKSDPWELPGKCEQERFFFSTKEVKYPNGNRSNRVTLSGYWKATGLDKQIVTSKSNQVVGMKKTLVFYRGKPPNGSRTDWIMHEYRLAAPQINNPAQGMENWVICRIFLKKRGSNGNEKNEENAKAINGLVSNCNSMKSKPIFYDFMAANKRRRTDLSLKPGLSYSGSSVITDDAGSCDEHEENSSNLDDVLRKKQSS
ncbi:NAC domain-containing protein 83-like [Rutidosis leptorrhynchoides]|uniref:NAC domain-containing protein 83-like n=1 Tax=Rutidosis leptorrhynchoides TaxID=125765 RepID=UPI003A990AF2